jgi:integrase
VATSGEGNRAAAGEDWTLLGLVRIRYQRISDAIARAARKETNMTEFVFKPKRRKNGKSVESRLYSGRYRLSGQTKTITVALGISDKQAAEAQLRKLIRDLEREAAGIIAPKRMRDAANKSLRDHLLDYFADLKARKRAADYIAKTEMRLRKLATECSWRQLIDVTAESFRRWRASQTLAAKTLNDYLAAVCAFFSWLEKAEAIQRNPLKHVGKVEARGNERRKRRAFTLDELARVIADSGRYRLALLTAYYTGLRRNELKQFECGDIQQASEGIFIVARASTTKNHKSQRQYMPVWFFAELAKAKPQDVAGNTRVFAPGTIPSMWKFKQLLELAGVPYKDDQGRQADFHALRRSVNTHLAQAAVDPQTRQEMMRHSELRLTLDVYTDKGMLPMAAAVEKLPMFPLQLKDAHPCAHNPDFSGHPVTSTGAAERFGENSEDPEIKEDMRSNAPAGMSGQTSEFGSRCRIPAYT